MTSPASAPPPQRFHTLDPDDPRRCLTCADFPVEESGKEHLARTAYTPAIASPRPHDPYDR